MLQKIRNFFTVYKRNKDGSAAVEFSLIAVPFLLAIFGIMEGGRIMWTVNSVQFAIEEAGRQVSIDTNLTDEDIQNIVRAKLEQVLINPDDLTVTTQQTTIDNIDFIQINAHYDMATIISFLIAGDFGDFVIESVIKVPLSP
jgi:Flp pilus assembly protein TadG